MKTTFTMSVDETTIRWKGYYTPAQNGGQTDPSFAGFWEIDGDIEALVMGQWFPLSQYQELASISIGGTALRNLVDTCIEHMAVSEQEYDDSEESDD